MTQAPPTRRAWAPAAQDVHWMRQALAQAELALPLASPNPAVGCVLVRDDQLLAQGHTQCVGGPHAEAMALRAAQAAGVDLRGACAYVSLEPCAHHGRTPPCADALVAAGITRVVVALPDPFAAVAGKGLARLRQAGVDVQLWPREDALAQQALEGLLGFFSRVLRQRPWVRMKVAMSLDARAALHNGASQWITAEPARMDGHLWRARASAILSGIGTVLADDPALSVRHPDLPTPLPRPPARWVLDSQWRTPPHAKLLQTPAPLVVVGQAPADAAAQSRMQALQALGAQTLIAPSAPAGQGVDLACLLQIMSCPSGASTQAVNELHVEAGPRLSAALLQGAWVDELLVYVAPSLLGPGRDALAWPLQDQLQGAWQGRWHEVQAIGEDLRLRLRPRREPGDLLGPAWQALYTSWDATQACG